MDQIQEKNMESSGKSRFLGTSQLVLSLSVFSFLFSYYYSFFSSSIFKSVSPLQLLTHSMDKTYVFLICNGILAFLVKTSGSVLCRSKFDLNEHKYVKSIQEGLQKATTTESKDEFILDEKEEQLVEEEKREYVYKDLGVEIEKKSPSLFMQQEEEEEEEEKKECGFSRRGGGEEEEEADQEDFVIDVKENLEMEIHNENSSEEEDGMEVLSTEELNKKFDEFIRKMKEELRVDAQRQIVMV